MKKQITVDVKNDREAQAIEEALGDAEIRAYCIIVGMLKPLSVDERERVMRCTCILHGCEHLMERRR